LPRHFESVVIDGVVAFMELDCSAGATHSNELLSELLAVYLVVSKSQLMNLRYLLGCEMSSHLEKTRRIMLFLVVVRGLSPIINKQRQYAKVFLAHDPPETVQRHRS
jgi:hypothetical protein